MADCVNCLLPCEECKKYLKKEIEDIDCDCGMCNECKNYQEQMSYYN